MPTVGPNMANTSAIEDSGTHTPVASDGVPADGVSGFGAGIIPAGGLAVNVADGDGDIYENQGTQASPTWVRVDTVPA